VETEMQFLQKSLIVLRTIGMQFVLALFLFGMQGANGEKYSIHVTILNLHSDKGKVFVNLYASEDGFPKDPSKAFKKMTRTISAHKCVLVFDNVPLGVYALACYHDENDNNELDKNFLGIPSEGVGASNNVKGTFGPPSFKDAQFPVNENINQNITVEY